MSFYAIKKKGKYVSHVKIPHKYETSHAKSYWRKQGYKVVKASSTKQAVEKSIKGMTIKAKHRKRSGFGGYGDIVGGYRLPSGGI